MIRSCRSIPAPDAVLNAILYAEDQADARTDSYKARTNRLVVLGSNDVAMATW
jgi:hypothetical protein